MNIFLLLAGIALVGIGMSAGFWVPFPISILIGMVLGALGGWVFASALV